MRIVESFRPHITDAQGKEVNIGEFKTYEEAYDAVILWASRKLPNEDLKSFRIEKVFNNVVPYSMFEH